MSARDWVDCAKKTPPRWRPRRSGRSVTFRARPGAVGSGVRALADPDPVGVVQPTVVGGENPVHVERSIVIERPALTDAGELLAGRDPAGSRVCDKFGGGGTAPSVSPAAPAAPSAPPAPSAPVEPAAPSAPAAPAEPSAPAEPCVPEAPDEPSAPAAPTEPWAWPSLPHAIPEHARIVANDA